VVGNGGSGNSDGLQGNGVGSGAGVNGAGGTSNGTGVFGIGGGSLGIGVVGGGSTGIGVQGTTTGVTAGVQGISTGSGAGVQGKSPSSTGPALSGDATGGSGAALHLTPQSDPASPKKGDVWMDAAGNLKTCKDNVGTITTIV
jgi:hypothetical protein